MLQVRGLRKRYTTTRGDVLAVRGLDFDVEIGEFVTLLGPSGCGKTTTLRCIAGLETPDEGSIIIDGQTVFEVDKKHKRETPIERRSIGVVFQSYAVWPHMTVFDNVAFPLRAMKPRPGDIADRVSEALSLVHLEKLADRPVPQLSGGQQQRVALARALVRRPSLLLLDEPLSNLDARLRAEMRAEVSELSRTAGVATVYVTHDQVEALTMSDRILVMFDGEVVQEGDPKSIYNRPVSRFVAEFVGETNLVPGQITSVSDSYADVLTDHGMLRASVGFAAKAGERVLVSARPEDIQFLGPGAPTEGSLSAVVSRVEFLGNHADYWLDVGGLSLRAMQHPVTAANVGDTVQLVLAPDRAVAVPEELATEAEVNASSDDRAEAAVVGGKER